MKGWVVWQRFSDIKWGFSVLKTLLQVAIDVIDLGLAIKIAIESIINGADIVEVGTPLIKMHGTLPIKLFKSISEGNLVLADLKTLDAGGLEAEIAFSNGADIISISALADKQTIIDTVDVAREHGGKVCADLLNVEKNKSEQLIKDLLDIGVDYILVHLGLDQQKRGLDIIEKMRDLAQHIPRNKLSVAGGINPSNIKDVLKFEPKIIVVGGAIYKSEKPGEIVRKLREILDSTKTKK